MRNKYKNLQNRGQSQKGSSFVIPENRNQILIDNNINYIHKNSFISNLDRRERGEKILNKTNDKDLKQIPFNRFNLADKNLDLEISKKNNNNTIKTSNHNILISVYTKESSNKNDTIITNNSTTNRNPNIKNNNNNKNESINANKTNNSISRNINNKINTGRRIFNSKRNNQNQNQIIVEKDKNVNSPQFFNFKKQNKNDKDIYSEDLNKNKNIILNYKRKKNSASYNNIINNTDMGKDKNSVIPSNIKKNERFMKPEKKEEKKRFSNENPRNYKSSSNIPIIGKKENININNNNNLEKKKLLNFRKIPRKDNINDINSNDDKSPNSPLTSGALSPNNNQTTRTKRKMTYRSKRSIRNIQEDKEQEDINNKKDNIPKNDGVENKYKRNYIIKVTKTPNESSTHKSIESHVKTEDVRTHKNKIRHFLYYKANKEEKEENLKDGKNLSPNKMGTKSTISFSEAHTSSHKNSFKKINNRTYKISPHKQSFKDLIHETNQNKNLHDSFSNIFQSCKNDIDSNKNDIGNTMKNQDLNNSFSCFSNELELNLDNKTQLFNYINASNIMNDSNNLTDTYNSSNNIFTTSSNNNNYKKNSIQSNTNNINSNIKVYSPHDALPISVGPMVALILSIWIP